MYSAIPNLDEKILHIQFTDQFSKPSKTQQVRISVELMSFLKNKIQLFQINRIVVDLTSAACVHQQLERVQQQTSRIRF